MNFLKKIFARVLLVFQFLLVFLFIIFEEIIWEGIAKPIYNKIQSLHILKKLETKVQHTHRYVVLTLFLVLLLGVEAVGLLAGVLFVQGEVLLGLVLYVTRVPITAFVFWLFKVAKEQLLSFSWFKYAYEKLMAGLVWLKEQETYKEMMAYMLATKTKIKDKWKIIKAKYFTEEGSFMKELKGFYTYMKNFKKSNKDNIKK